MLPSAAPSSPPGDAPASDGNDSAMVAAVAVAATRVHRNRDVFPASAEWFILNPQVGALTALSQAGAA